MRASGVREAELHLKAFSTCLDTERAVSETAGEAREATASVAPAEEITADSAAAALLSRREASKAKRKTKKAKAGAAGFSFRETDVFTLRSDSLWQGFSGTRQRSTDGTSA